MANLSAKRTRQERRFSSSAFNIVGFILLRSLAGIVNFFPFSFSSWIARRIADFLFFALRKRRKIAYQNLDLVFAQSKTPDQKRKILRASFCNLITSLMEFVRMPKTMKDPGSRFRFQGMENLEHALKRKQGAILVMAHLGSWEYLTFLPLLGKYKSVALGRPVRNPYVHRWVQSLRRTDYLAPVKKIGAAKAMLAALHQNHLVFIAIDQWAGQEGVWVDFFGKKTSTTSIPVRLAKRTGGALLPSYCMRVGDGHYEIQIKEEVLIRGSEQNWEKETTEALNRILEQQIVSYPEQWTWTHRRWKDENDYLKK